ncbi:hypothetical protein QN277_028486 [Acacia crassicarpa]|uniref:Uncharacterized protein n=1 Tax=Acacia crassicarpa TaxID=499986 RepID=A0AAE1MF68_9FABA|nr:hypothetical protein QN277_028486 [Acacia crassicarpa]
MECERQIREAALEGSFCKCGEGWTCVISKSSGPEEQKPYFKCGESCECSIIDGVKEEVVPSEGASGAYCKCAEGWSCVISRVQPSDAQKGFECSGPCTCEAK